MASSTKTRKSRSRSRSRSQKPHDGTSNGDRTGQKRARLMQLSKEAKHNLYEMLKLVDEILSDRDFVRLAGGEASLLSEFQEKDFSHFGGTPSLSAMLRAYRANPDIETWQEHGFRIRVMIDLAQPETESGPKERVNWKSLAKQLEAEVKNLRVQLDESRKLNQELQERVENQASEIGELRGQLKLYSERRL